MRSERGAITIHVALALMGMLMFAGVVIDQGVMYVARRQAQNAADAGALAGAVTLMLDPGKTVEARIAAQTLASQNAVWGEATANADIRVSPLPYNCPDGVPSCIQVDVLRGLPNSHDGSTHTNTIPTYLVRLVGPVAQGVRATATAQIAAGNAVRCIKPWVVADKWVDNTPASASNPAGWDQNDTFDPGDTYTPPQFAASGTNNDYGLQLVLKAGNSGTLSAGWTFEIDLGGVGSSDYRDEIERCPGYVPEVGLYKGLPVACSVKTDENPPQGCLGVKTGMSQGPTQGGVGTLIGLDSSATWDPSTKTVQGGCMATGTCINTDSQAVQISPRIVPLAIFDVASFAASGCSGTNCVAKVVNLLGFFIEGMCNDVYPNVATRPTYCGTPSEAQKAVVGRLMAYPGQFDAASGSAGPATFLKVLRLIR